jgi:hypothetical protein
MTNIRKEIKFPMITPVKINKFDFIPFYSNLSFEHCSALQDYNVGLYCFATDIFYKLIKNENLFAAMSVDVSFVKKKYSKNTITNHIKWLVDSNIIKKFGNRNSWIYHVNPCIAHKLVYEQQEDYRKNYRDYFGKISIV